MIADPSGGGDGMENDLELNAKREAAPNKFVKLQIGSESSPAGDGVEEPSSGFVGPVVPRLPGSFSVGNMPLSNDPAMFSGQLISPTHPQGPLQYMQHQVSQTDCTRSITG